MTGEIDVIHHPGLIAQDIEAAVAQYEKLGFIFTPLSMHRIALKPNEEPVYFGVGNRNAIFERNFLEDRWCDRSVTLESNHPSPARSLRHR